jgi:type IV secretory pathway component VirB8
MTKTSILILMICLISCNNIDSRLDKTLKRIEFAEINKNEFTKTEWDQLESLITDLQNDYISNREQYSEDQAAQVGKLIGRYSALKLKKGSKDVEQLIIDLGNQIEGFIDGLSEN